MPASQNTMCGTNCANFSSLRIGHFYFLCTSCIAKVLDSHYGAVKTYTSRRGRLVQPIVICPRHYDVIGRGAGDGIGNQCADQQARDRSIPVGKVKEVFSSFLVRNGVAIHSFFWFWIEFHALETWSA